jgi:uncharacterized protein YdhG (YjbR/CyaY superfamily)
LKKKHQLNTVDGYIEAFSDDVKIHLKTIRKLILDLAPQAIESMAYNMPAYKVNNKPLVYFAAFKNHIGFYATPTGHSAFQEALQGYKQGRGSVQFPLDASIPYSLIQQMVLFRLSELNEKNINLKK